MNFRHEEYDDAQFDALAVLWVEAWNVAMPQIDFQARVPWLKQHLATISATGTRIVVARGAIGLAGFATIDPARGWIDQLAVATRAQGTGAARFLLACARKISPAILRLDVNADNHRARAFYTREGFKIVGKGQNPVSGLATLTLEWRAGG